jgi:trk system potassium uptake protein
MQIIIIGCGKVGSSLASELVAQGHDVVIVDSDPQLIQNADELDCIKITGVPIDRDVLRQAGIETADVICATTQNDNINIMAAQIAKNIFHVPKIVSRIFNPGNREVFDEFNLDTICQTELSVQAFLRKIAGENDEQVHRVFNTDLLYSSIPIDEELVGQQIDNLSAEAGKMIIGLLRDGQLRLAVSGTKVQAGDELVLVTIQE